MMGSKSVASKSAAAIRYSQQAERLSGHLHNSQKYLTTGSTTAFQAKFITPHDPVIETADGSRLPSVPLEEAEKLNRLKNQIDSRDPADGLESCAAQEDAREPYERGDDARSSQSSDPSATLRTALPPSRTNPLFPPLPLYGPSTWLRDIQCMAFRVSSFILSLNFLLVIVLGAAATSIPLMLNHIGIRLMGGKPDARRPFHEEEECRKAARKKEAESWRHERRRRSSHAKLGEDSEEGLGQQKEYVPTEGGRDPLVCDVGYYARRVGLDVEDYEVQTEDGFIIQLWHLYNPKEYQPRPAEDRKHRGPELFQSHHQANGHANGYTVHPKSEGQKEKYPVLLIHGLLQSAGAYCSNDDESLAFFLCKR